MKELIKAALVLAGYLCIAPMIGIAIRNNRAAQRWLFGLLVFMTSWHVSHLTVMLHSVEWYRGHTKGFEFSMLEIAAIALLVASFLGRDRAPRLLSPGIWLYLLYVALSCISIFAAPAKLYVAMAAFKFGKLVLVYLAAYHFLRDEDDLRVLLKALAVTLCVQALVVLKMRYVDGVYQVNGWFEHQNALGMWAYLCGLPLLAAGLGRARIEDLPWYLAGFAASAIIILFCLSRGSVAALAAGVVMVMALSLLEEFTLRRVVVMGAITLFACVVIAATFSTVRHRFAENKNQASAEARVVLNRASKAMLRDSAIGIGWNNFALVMNPPFRYGEVLDDWNRSRGFTVNRAEPKPQTESHYWLVLAENGYPGFLAYCLFITVTGLGSLWVLWTLRHTFAGSFLIGLTVALLLVYVHSSIERVLTQTKNAATWLMFLGVVARMSFWRKTSMAA